MGYTGGTKPKPTYEQVCSKTTGHAEVVLIEYDPKVISYETLLEKFWSIHDPTQVDGQGVNIGSNYRSAIFCHSDQQLASATASRDSQRKKLGKPLATQIAMAMPFYLGEDYHQQYYEKKGLAACPPR